MQKQSPTIIVEGPDGSGKSTLIARLAEALGMEAIHTGGACNTLEQLVERLEFVESQPGKLFDRCSHISNGIYARALGRDEFMSETEVSKRLQAFTPLVIYCRIRGPHGAEVMRDFMVKTGKPHKSEGYSKAVLDRHDQIVSDYDRVMGGLLGLVPILTYDFLVDTFEDLVSSVRKFQID